MRRSLYRTTMRTQSIRAASPPFLLMGRPWDGYGDAIQGARYVSDAVRACGPFVLVTTPNLVRLFGGLGLRVSSYDEPSENPLIGGRESELFQRAKNICEIVDRDEPGRGVYFLSVGHYRDDVPCGTLGRLVDIRANRQLLFNHVPPVASLLTDQTIRHSYRVGLCCSGLGHVYDMRGVSTAALQPLLDMPFKWLALHTVDPMHFDDHHDRSGALGLPGLASLGARDWADTAGIIQQLELVITTDTAVAHLAGTLGVPTFVMLIKDHDALWGREDTTPLYPSVQIFRQETAGDWAPVIAAVRDVLEQFTSLTQAA